jgi:hypothetical protein
VKEEKWIVIASIPMLKLLDCLIGFVFSYFSCAINRVGTVRSSTAVDKNCKWAIDRQVEIQKCLQFNRSIFQMNLHQVTDDQVALH